MKDPRVETSNSESASSCEAVEERIHDLMDVRKPLLSDAIVREHIAHCDECVELVVDLGALNESLSQIPLETIHRLSELSGPSVEAAEPVRSRSHLHPLSFVTSVACLLLVMLTSGVWFSNSDDRSPHRVEYTNHEMVSVAPVEKTPTEIDGPRQQLAFLPSTHKTTPPGEFLNAVSFEQISDGVEPIQSYLLITSDLPGISPISNSVNATYHLIKTISDESVPQKDDKDSDTKDEPNVGCHGSCLGQLCCV